MTNQIAQVKLNTVFVYLWLVLHSDCIVNEHSWLSALNNTYFCVCVFLGQSAPYSPEGAALGGYGLDAQSHLGLRTAGESRFCKLLSIYYLSFYK